MFICFFVIKLFILAYRKGLKKQCLICSQIHFLKRKYNFDVVKNFDTSTFYCVSIKKNHLKTMFNSGFISFLNASLDFLFDIASKRKQKTLGKNNPPCCFSLLLDYQSGLSSRKFQYEYFAMSLFCVVHSLYLAIVF